MLNGEAVRAQPNIGVFYLHRRGNSVVYFKEFIKSVAKFPTRVNYTLYVICKGFSDGDLDRNIKAMAGRLGCEVKWIYIDDAGFDLTAYRMAAEQASVDYCLFFNSYSRILSSFWLEAYLNTLSLYEDNFLVGATGSYARWGVDTSFTAVSAPFSTAHIRTNAFFISRKLYLSFSDSLQTKFDCYMFESGEDSISQRILRSGGHLALIDKHGRVSPPADWPDVHAFFSGRQENLLVADNHTYYYQIAKFRRRRRLAEGAWGRDRGTAKADSWLVRKLWKIYWKYGIRFW